MATPTVLSGSASAIKVDGTDLHTWGMIVDKVDNPVPSGKSSTISVFGRDGDFDFTKNYSPRTMNISGHIIGNSNADLLANIDLLKSFFRLRENNECFQVIFQNQSDRYWTCKFQGAFSIQPVGLWYSGKICSFDLQLKCVKPYAEKTSVTTVSAKLSMLNSKTITYAGTLACPVVINMKAPYSINLIESTHSAHDPSETVNDWTGNNCTVSASTSWVQYGTYSILATRSAPGTFYLEIDILAAINAALVTGGGIVVQGFCLRSGNLATATTLDIIQNGSGGNKSVNFHWDSASHPKTWTYLKISAADLAGVTSAKLRFICTGATAGYIFVDGIALYEITAAQYLDSTFVPPPYVSLIGSGSKVDVYQPKVTIQNSVNIFKYGKGDNLTGWTGGTGYIQSVVDPLNPAGKCFIVAGGGAAIYSPKIYFNVQKYIKISFQYFKEKYAAHTHMDINISNEYGTLVYSEISDILGAGANTGWTTYQGTIYPTITGCILRVEFTPDAGNKFYIKNIMVEESDAVDGIYSVYTDYVETSVLFDSTIYENDNLIYDSENLIATFYDYSAHAGSNVMTNITGNRLMLNPGRNSIRYTDYRLASGEGSEGGSEGAINLDLSYRERYL